MCIYIYFFLVKRASSPCTQGVKLESRVRIRIYTNEYAQTLLLSKYLKWIVTFKYQFDLLFFLCEIIFIQCSLISPI
jgi:hypothetical protein